MMSGPPPTDAESDLRRELDAARSECARLQAEVNRLRGLLGLPADALPSVVSERAPTLLTLEQPLPAIHADSPTSEKIALFRSLFRGREDVYPVIWVNDRTGKTGYAPATAGGAWAGKRGRAREYLPLIDEVIARHLMGEHTIGVCRPGPKRIGMRLGCCS